MNLHECMVVPLIFFNLKKLQMKQLFESFPYDRHNNSLSKNTNLFFEKDFIRYTFNIHVNKYKTSMF